MNRLLLCRLIALLLSPSVFAAELADWPMWRGPNGDGKSGQQKLPQTWSQIENVLWRAEVPGNGNSSPTIVGRRLFLTTADEDQQVQSVVCLDPGSGEQLWRTDIHNGNFIEAKRVHKMCTNASCSVVCDGERVIATFMNDNAIWTTALDLDGKQLWQHRVCDFESQFGYGSSLWLHGDNVLVAVDNAPENTVVALITNPAKSPGRSSGLPITRMSRRLWRKSKARISYCFPGAKLLPASILSVASNCGPRPAVLR